MHPDAFAQAVESIASGNEPLLSTLLADNPGLTRERAPQPHRATLLHYVAANGLEIQRSPGNAPAIARILLEAGADPDAVAPVYSNPAADTTLGLTVTSAVPYFAGVQEELVDVLIDYGARIEGIANDGGPLGCALLFGYRGAAERLVLRGARAGNLIYCRRPGKNRCRPPHARCRQRDRWHPAAQRRSRRPLFVPHSA